MTDDDFKKHKLSHHLRAVNSVVDEAMPHVERIEALVQENPDFFGAAAGQLKIKAAADFLEALARDYAKQGVSLVWDGELKGPAKVIHAEELLVESLVVNEPTVSWEEAIEEAGWQSDPNATDQCN